MNTIYKALFLNFSCSTHVNLCLCSILILLHIDPIILYFLSSIHFDSLIDLVGVHGLVAWVGGGLWEPALMNK